VSMEDLAISEGFACVFITAPEDENSYCALLTFSSVVAETARLTPLSVYSIASNVIFVGKKEKSKMSKRELNEELEKRMNGGKMFKMGIPGKWERTRKIAVPVELRQEEAESQ